MIEGDAKSLDANVIGVVINNMKRDSVYEDNKTDYTCKPVILQPPSAFYLIDYFDPIAVNEFLAC